MKTSSRVIHFVDNLLEKDESGDQRKILISVIDSLKTYLQIKDTSEIDEVFINEKDPVRSFLAIIMDLDPVINTLPYHKVVSSVNLIQKQLPVNILNASNPKIKSALEAIQKQFKSVKDLSHPADTGEILRRFKKL